MWTIPKKKFFLSNSGGLWVKKGNPWLGSLTQWTWVWVNSGSWWWTGRPGMLRFMGSQRVGHNWATELNWLMTVATFSFSPPFPVSLISQRQPSWVSTAQWMRPGYENRLTFLPKCWPDVRAGAAAGVEVLLKSGFVSSSLLLSTGFCRCSETRLLLLLSHPPTFWATENSVEVFPEEAHRREKSSNTLVVSLPRHSRLSWKGAFNWDFWGRVSMAIGCKISFQPWVHQSGVPSSQ